MNDYGYVCFSYSNVWYDWCITKVTASRWSHAFITIPSIVGKQMVLQAVTSGVSAVPFDSAYRNNDKISYEIYKFKIKKGKIDSSISRCMNRLGTSYGFLEYPWLLWRALNMLVGRDIKSHSNWCEQGTICSGLVRSYIEECGYNFFSEFGKDAVNPQDAYVVIKSHPELFELVESK